MWPDTPGRPIGMGCMRLSTDPNRDDDRSIAVLHAALDAGVRLFDTADAYAWHDGEVGHNERLIAQAIASWNGPRDQVLVATKGGLTRPQAAWIPDGRARHLQRACESSLRALGLERIPLYQLHAPDPRTPIATSIRALQDLKDQGLIAAIGICNVNFKQVEEARQLAEIAAVQIEFSPWLDDGVLNGVIPYCIREGIRVLIHRPLGGPKGCRRIARDAAFTSVADRLGATAVETALAWIGDLSPALVPLPGATRPETPRSIVRAQQLPISADDREVLDARFHAAGPVRSAATPRQHVTAPVSTKGEVIMLMGLPGAGKSTFARRLVDEGYVRLNRDERGGTLRKLLPALDRELSAGHTKIVLDNTYVTRKSRAAVVLAAARHGLAVRCLWLDTDIEGAQVNAAERMMATHGRLLEPDEIRRASKRDPNTFAPGAQFRALRELEPPDASEGFSRIERMQFTRVRNDSFVNRAVIVWCDGVLWRSRSGGRVPTDPADMEVDDEKGERLRGLEREGWRVLGLSWQPEVGDGTRSPDDVQAAIMQLRARLGVMLDVAYCTHPAGPPVCWCRKPLPGLGVLLVHRHQLDAAASLYIGSGPQDPGFARKLGFQYRDAADFFRPTVAADEL
jgi:aryl-alcohol dehydrogenase-like predicted oxidoreductase/predicted kinase/histidinol phosphatase-like enzyme